MLNNKHTFTLKSRVGPIIIEGNLYGCVWDNLTFNASAEFHALPDSEYLEHLITYAILEGPRLKSGESLDFVLDNEADYPPSWTWEGDEMGDITDSISFAAY